ncbi:alpha beta-hydrolase [Stemphylium lycopersici]|nr:alpha beta-hydrolase [Stemphylium lycopersici]RAR00194.1 alpha beta-hydrolase [Stemphylium lycopersici]
MAGQDSQEGSQGGQQSMLASQRAREQGEAQGRFSKWFPLSAKSGFEQWWAGLSPMATEHRVLSFIPHLQSPPTHTQTGSASASASTVPSSADLHAPPKHSEDQTTTNAINDPYGPRRWNSQMVELSGKDRALNEFSVERLGEEVENNLVMLHGYGAGLGFFYRNFESISRAEGWKVFALDLLGMGRSSRPPFKIHAKDKDGKISEAESWFVDALEEWRIKRGLDRFTLLGHSLGGYLAVAYALKYPGHLNKLILASPVGIPEDPYAVDEEMPDPQDSSMANEFTQDAAETNISGVQPSTADNNNFMNQQKGKDTAKEAKQPPKRRLPWWLYSLWEANMISPFTFVRWSGPLGPRLVSGWTSRRFSQLPEEEAQALHDYSYALFRQRGSSEYALAYLLAPGAFARSPLIRRIQGVGRQWIQAHDTPTVDGDAPPNPSAENSQQSLSSTSATQRENGYPVIFMYGENDWMDVAGGFAAEEKMKQERERILASASSEERKKDHGVGKVVIINKAGHHVYLDGWEQFNRVMLEEMEERHTTTTSTGTHITWAEAPKHPGRAQHEKMAPHTLDQMVKGAPPPNTNVNKVAESVDRDPPPYSASILADSPHDANDRLPTIKTPRPPVISDPTSLLPSSPPQIYLNLLILEASLRSQYLTLRARRRQNTFVLTLLAVWIGFCFYLLWLRPREDGKGIGGSQYWLLDMLQKVGFITGVVTALLFWATGQWERGVRWPRRWIGVANRGLRGMNAKIVVIRGPWWRELVEWAHFVVPFSGGLWGGEQGGSSYHFINVAQENKYALDGGRPRHRIVEDGKEYAEEDIAPGGDYIKLLLLPKPFTPDFRQEWEVYRNEYWATENERRAELRKRVRARQREIAREEGGWLWWTGWRGWKRARGLSGRSADVEKSGHHHSHSLSHSGSRKRRLSTLQAGRGREGSHSRSSSRSTTPTPDLDLDGRLRPMEGRERRWSNTSASTTTSRKSSLRSNSTITQGNAQSARQPPLQRPGSGCRPSTPNESNLPWQSKRASMLSNAESLSELDEDDGGYDAASEGRADASPVLSPSRSFGSKRSNREGRGNGRAESA